MSGLEKGEEPGENRLSVSSRQDAQAEFERRVSNVVDVLDGSEVNASGHEDQLERQYGIWSLCGLALTIDNAWVALGGSIIVASCKHAITDNCILRGNYS
jgi:choline transport protein